MSVLYLDSSAIVKLIAAEVESPVLISLVARFPARASSAIARVEIGRALKRAARGSEWETRAAAVLGSISLISVDGDILEKAAHTEPRNLRALDAIHLASALALGSDLEAVVAYDRRLLAAAEQIGLRTLQPV